MTTGGWVMMIGFWAVLLVVGGWATRVLVNHRVDRGGD